LSLSWVNSGISPASPFALHLDDPGVGVRRRTPAGSELRSANSWALLHGGERGDRGEPDRGGDAFAPGVLIPLPALAIAGG